MHLRPQGKESNSLSWGHNKLYTPGIIANSQTDRTATKINRNAAVATVRILVKLEII